MKFKRYMAASMAAVMAVSSAIVCQISVSAAETDITSQITSGISVSELSQYTSLKVTYKPSPTADGKCGHTHDDGSTYCPWAQVPFIANSVEGIDADIVPDKKKSTWYQPDNPFTAKSGKDEEETTAEVEVADILDSFTKDKDWKDTFTLKSVTVQCWSGTLSKVVGVTGSEDTRTDAEMPDYDASPITMTKQAAQSWCPNGTAQGMMPVTIDGITTGTTTYGEIKDKFKNITFNGIDFVKDSIGGSASDYTYCLYAQWGSGWSWTASDSVSLDSKTKWSVTGIAEKYHADQVKQGSDATINDTDVLQVIGIQINMADNKNLPAGVAALKTDETFTINPAGAAVESVEITLTDGTAVGSSYTYGDTINLKATVLPAGADGADKVEWASETPDVATVDENGEVTLLKAGEAKITATAGGVSNFVTFTVNKKKLTVAPSALTNIYVKDNEIEAAAKAKDVTAKYALENVENVSLVKGTDYTVSEPQISADKKYYSITITLSDDAAGKYELSTTTLKGYISYELTSIALNSDTLNLVAGADGRRLVATTTPDSALLDNLTFTYKSSDESVATVDENGLVTPLKAGTATITVTAKAVVTTNGMALFTTTATAKCTVTVTDKAIPATNIELDAFSKTMTVGDKAKLTATVKPADTTDKIVWTSSKPTVAAVDENGNITALAAGTTEITATAGSVSAVCKVTVEAVKVSEVKLDKTSVSLKAGETAQLTAAVTPDNAADKTVTWTSSDEKIATVADGKITAVAPGTATITATAGGKSAACTVTVTKAAQNIKDTKKYPSVPKDYAKVDPVVTTVNSDGTKNMLVMFSISDSDVKNFRGARITFMRADGKTFSRSLILDRYYTDVTYLKDGDNYNGNGQNYIVIRLRNVDDSWGGISAKFELINGLG